MTHVIIIAPSQELILHNVAIYDNGDVRRVQAFIDDKIKDYIDLERILVSMGTVRIMEKDQAIPVPLCSLPRSQSYHVR